MLCSLCQNIAVTWLVPRFYDIRDSKYPAHQEPVHWWTHSSWADFLQAAKTCRLCALILSEMQDTTREDYWKTTQLGIRFTAYGKSMLEVTCVEMKKQAKLNVGMNHEDLLRAPSSSCNLFTTRLISPQAGSPRNISTIEQWLSICKNTHKKCTLNSTNLTDPPTRHLPTRVLDVGSIGSPFIHLDLPLDTDTAPYAALTYCWGLGNTYTTTNENLSQHLSPSGIKIADLPATLRDAVELTRLLGIKYVWIDALCIIQQDRDDWIREAATMNTVYSRALLTISATATFSASDGIFKQRPKKLDQFAELPWPQDNNQDPLSIIIAPRFQGDAEIATLPHSNRGWTFQERALSSRVVHFGTEQCYWECRELCTAEDIDPSQGGYYAGDRFYKLRNMLLGPVSSSDTENPMTANSSTTDTKQPLSKEEKQSQEEQQEQQEDDIASLHDTWAWIISHFSTRALTNPTDIFPALSGIATLFASLPPTPSPLGTYVAGMWQHQLHRNLLWRSSRTSNPPMPHHRPEPYRAPSWSWASVSGPITCPASERHFEISRAVGSKMTSALGEDTLRTRKLLAVREITIKTEGPTPYGPILSAVAKFRGFLVPVRRTRLLVQGQYILVDAGDANRVVGMVVWDTDEVPAREMHLWVCPVMERASKGAKGEVLGDCLVLKVAGGNEGGEMTFLRVGVGIVGEECWKGAVWEFSVV
ncbi:heterokaryon incompatibility protein-domain-containing protein [Dendryphion nanum]|uniref:Heterokaryon incompatibility protein-domain-containing protein n=1 Tax=Dendryphion nanum TaxID=256645 RepID=A0A9P9IYC8_9PLEO|nr:heterokaryon incompatibility protein-domain-containing protein [Dendryphion nanum]